MTAFDSAPTRAAQVSPPGIGGISVIQVIGPQALDTVVRFLRNLSSDRPPQLVDDRLRLLRWMDGDEHVDHVVVTASGHDRASSKVCVNTHGGLRVVERILMSLQHAGVEVVRDLTSEQVWDETSLLERAALSHLRHAKTRPVALWLIAQLEALPMTLSQCAALLGDGQTTSVMPCLQNLAHSYASSRRLLDGVQVAIVGPPNSGKSTLANRLFEKPWSVESDVPGTTRDWVQQNTAIGGVPITLVDTAGLRQAGELESAAIRAARPLIEQAVVQLVVEDIRRPVRSLADFGTVVDPARAIRVWNKIDLLAAQLDASNEVGGPVAISALHGQGLQDLRIAILKKAGLDHWPRPAIWDPDQLRAIQEAMIRGTDAPDRAADILEHSFLVRLPKK